MPHSFPRGLIACIRDGRSPLPEEVISLSSKLWDEGLSYRSPLRPELAQSLAEVALVGCAPGSTTSQYRSCANKLAEPSGFIRGANNSLPPVTAR